MVGEKQFYAEYVEGHTRGFWNAREENVAREHAKKGFHYDAQVVEIPNTPAARLGAEVGERDFELAALLAPGPGGGKTKLGAGIVSM